VRSTSADDLAVVRVVVDERVGELPHRERIEPRALGRGAELADELSQHRLGERDDAGTSSASSSLSGERSGTGPTRSRPPP
jgi:hypothetical protein